MKFMVCACSFFFSLLAKAQLPDEIKIYIEKYLENTESAADYTQVYEGLAAYLEKPMLLNVVTLPELLDFPLIGPAQAVAIIDHRNKFGHYMALNELQVVGLDPLLIRAIRPFVSIAPGNMFQKEYLDNVFQKGKLEIVNTLGQRYPRETGFAGPTFSHSLRVKYSWPKHYSVGFAADKDAGEKYWYDSGRIGPDFYSFHAAVKDLHSIKAAVVGDFLLNFGQGLVMGSGLGIGKSANVLNIKRTGAELKPYRGMNEFQFFRGGAMHLEHKKISWVASVSGNALDARLGVDSTLDQGGFSSVDLDGYHRSAAEIANRGNTRRQMLGTWLQYRDKKGNIGAGAVQYRYNVPLNSTSELYKLYYPTGKLLNFYHAFQGYTFRQFHFFSEVAWLAQNSTHALNLGALGSLGRNAELGLMYRDYSPGFISPFSTAFGNFSQNERGMYLGLKIKFSARLNMNQYVDVWQNPWLAFRNSNPAKNSELFWQLEYNPEKKTSIILRYRNIHRQQNFSFAGPFKFGEDYWINAFRIHVNSPLSKTLQLEMRAENSYFKQDRNKYTSGLIFAELSAKPRNFLQGFSMVGRYSIFNVPYYYNRLYAFENQLLYSYGTVAMYGKGYSWYILANYKFRKYFKIGLRYNFQRAKLPTQTNYSDKQGIFAQLIFSH